MTSALRPSMTKPPMAQGQLLKGRYLEPYRSRKGKLKGLTLQISVTLYTIKLPKYLRPMLLREIAPGDFLEVWAYPDDGIWRAVNVLPMSAAEAERLQKAWQASPPEPLGLPPSSDRRSQKSAAGEKKCIQVCRKGACYKQGSKHIWSALQAEVERNPDLQHISIEATGCMKACKKGPNLKVLPAGTMLTGMTPEQALDVLGQCE